MIKRTLRPALLILLLMLTATGCDDGDSNPDGGPPDGDVPDGDSEPEELPPPVSEEIGNDGGEVELANGTILEVPPGVVEDEIEFRIIPVEREPVKEDGGPFVPIGVAFQLEPQGESPEPLRLHIPATLLPSGFAVDDIVLVVVDNGLVDTEEGGEEDRLSVVWNSDEVTEELALFEERMIGNAVYQPMARVVDDGSTEEAGSYDEEGRRRGALDYEDFPADTDNCGGVLGSDILDALGTNKLGINLRFKLSSDNLNGDAEVEWGNHVSDADKDAF